MSIAWGCALSTFVKHQDESFKCPIANIGTYLYAVCYTAMCHAVDLAGHCPSDFALVACKEKIGV